MTIRSRLERLEGQSDGAYRVVVLRPHESEADVRERWPGEKIVIVRTGISRTPTDPMLTGGAA